MTIINPIPQTYMYQKIHISASQHFTQTNLHFPYKLTKSIALPLAVENPQVLSVWIYFDAMNVNLNETNGNVNWLTNRYISRYDLNTCKQRPQVMYKVWKRGEKSWRLDRNSYRMKWSNAIG